jgi:flagellar M-ring protein FliF
MFGGDGTDYASAKQHFEKLWTDKVRDALSYVPGVVVAANVELDPELRRTQRSTKFNPKGFTRRSVDRTKSSTSSAPTPQGRPGVEAQSNSVMTPGSVSREAAQSQTEETESVAEKITDRDDYISDKAPLIPERVTVTVSIPSNYYLDIWRQRNPPAGGQPAPEPAQADLTGIEDEEKQKVEDIVVSLLPVPKEDLEDPYPRVRVTTYQSMPMAEAPAPAMTAKAITWLGDNWSKLGLALVGLFGLLMLRSMIRSVPVQPTADPQATTPALRVVQTEDSEQRAAEPEPEEKVLRGAFDDAGPNLREELTEMVRGNPDAAATILKNWISTPA